MNKEEKLKWRNLSGTFRMGKGTIIKPNQVFSATQEEIPRAFRDTVIPVEPLPETLKSAGGYTVKHRGAGWYDVLDAQGKTVNEKGLRQQEAQALFENLQAGRVTEPEPEPEPESEPEPQAAAPAEHEEEVGG